ncbi:hypothetical protein [Oceanobacillus jeddahense]|nr:hypothetical protein [Oceanobacillus jeddahense]
MGKEEVMAEIDDEEQDISIVSNVGVRKQIHSHYNIQIIQVLRM